MELHYRVRTYPNAAELEAALPLEAAANWHLKHLCSQGENGVLAVYGSDAPGEDIPHAPAWDHAAQAAQEANLSHEFTDPRVED